MTIVAKKPAAELFGYEVADDISKHKSALKQCTEALVENAAALSRCDTHHKVHVVRLRQLGPIVLDVALVLRWNGQSRTIVHAVVVEEDSIDLVPFLQRRFSELIG